MEDDKFVAGVLDPTEYNDNLVTTKDTEMIDAFSSCKLNMKEQRLHALECKVECDDSGPTY